MLLIDSPLVWLVVVTGWLYQQSFLIVNPLPFRFITTHGPKPVSSISELAVSRCLRSGPNITYLFLPSVLCQYFHAYCELLPFYGHFLLFEELVQTFLFNIICFIFRQCSLNDVIHFEPAVHISGF